MGMKSRQLHGRSELLSQDGSIVPVSGVEGTLRMDPAQWSACRQQFSENIGKTVSEILLAHPEHKAALGLHQEQTNATLSLKVVLNST